MRLAASIIFLGAAVRSAAAESPDREGALTHDAEADTADGDMLPWMVGTRHERREAQALATVGRDASTNTTTFTSSVEATLIDRVAIRAAFANDGYDPTIRPTVGLAIDAPPCDPRAGSRRDPGTLARVFAMIRY